jgi:hypothetical protein
MEGLRQDLQRVSTTPNLSVIAPNNADNGHDRQQPIPSEWAAYWVRQIMASPAYRQDGMIIIVYDENSDANFFSVPISGQLMTACCGEIPGPNSPSTGGLTPQGGGGETGAWVVTPYGTPGYASAGSLNVSATHYYNHYSLLRSLEDIFGITSGGADGAGHLGYAAGNGGPNDLPHPSLSMRSLGCDDIFTKTCPPMGAAVPAPSPTRPGARSAARTRRAAWP